MTNNQEQTALQMRRHTVVFTKTLDRLVLVRALQGLTTKAIAAETGLSEAQVQYRILKAQRSQNTRFRNDYRSGQGSLVKAMLKATTSFGETLVRHKIAPHFAPMERISAS